ncbi:MAG: hypothetical protein HY558_01695 [Euryarchaeota archaeon]|nr:hypothetical protein [Euryarchaeota archaeon]
MKRPRVVPPAYVDEVVGLVDAATKYWLEHRGRAAFITLFSAVLMVLAGGHILHWGGRMDRLSIVQSLIVLVLSLGMSFHHRQAKGVWVHTSKIPVCHGFVGWSMVAISLVFLYLGLKTTGW